MSTAIAMNPGGGSNAVAPEQANISVPMPDEQIKGSIAGLSTDFTFTVEKLGAAAASDHMDILKVSDDYLRVDGPDRQPGTRKSQMPAEG